MDGFKYRVSGRRRCTRVVAARVLQIACAVMVAGAASPVSASAADAYSWASSSMSWSTSTQIVPASALRRGAGATITRGEFVAALARLDYQRSRRLGTARTLPAKAPALADAPANSVPARAIAAGWVSPLGASFSAGRAVTAQEASRAVVSALGLSRSAALFAKRLRAGVPGATTNYYHASFHVYTRTLGLRYNHLQGSEQFERNPADHMLVGHVAYMLKRAATLESWKIDAARSLENFKLPALGPNQTLLLRRSVQLLGYTYVWGGQSEVEGLASQPQRRAGFDCSGFTLRVLTSSGVPAAQLNSVRSRTSMDMSSEFPAAQRLRASSLRPGDMMFFGYKGTSSKPAQNYHAGIYMGGGYIIHTSGGNDGVNIDRFSGYWKDHFSWGRRVLVSA